MFVFDSSAVIQIKLDVRPTDQWHLLTEMATLVATGVVCFPRQVVREMREIRWADAPGVWIQGVSGSGPHPPAPDWDFVEAVMSTPGAKEVVDPDAETEKADPYVIALAMQLRDKGLDACVVTIESVDRPPRVSMLTACARLDVPCMTLRDFLNGCFPTIRLAGS